MGRRVKKYLFLMFKRLKKGGDEWPSHESFDDAASVASVHDFFKFYGSDEEVEVTGTYVVPILDLTDVGRIINELEARTGKKWDVEVKEDMVVVKVREDPDDVEDFIYVSTKGVDEKSVEEALRDLGLEFMKVGDGFVVR